jgi:hypothetical protein
MTEAPSQRSQTIATARVIINLRGGDLVCPSFIEPHVPLSVALRAMPRQSLGTLLTSVAKFAKKFLREVLDPPRGEGSVLIWPADLRPPPVSSPRGETAVDIVFEML